MRAFLRVTGWAVCGGCGKIQIDVRQFDRKLCHFCTNLKVNPIKFYIINEVCEKA